MEIFSQHLDVALLKLLTVLLFLLFLRKLHNLCEVTEKTEVRALTDDHKLVHLVSQEPLHTLWKHQLL